MTLPFPIAASQVDAKSPVDDDLMEAIKADLDYLDTQLNLGKSIDYQFKLNGILAVLPTNKYRRIDGAFITNDVTLVSSRVYLEKPGTSGTLEIDIKKVSVPNTPITAVARLFSSSIDSIARAGAGDSTQSVSRVAAQISTQSISLWKAALNITSIVPLGNNLFRYNFSSAPDSDWIAGEDSVTFASCTDSNNDGTFAIVRVNDDGGANVVVENALGVAQSGTAGTGSLEAWSYNFTNPVSSQYVAGEQALFASHSDAANDGLKTVYSINEGGNNIIVKSATGVAQGGAAGNANVQRWAFTFSSAASSDYSVGEKAETSGHTSAANDGQFTIVAVNSGGNNVVLYNPAGVSQGGVAGTVNTLRWIYSFATDPSSGISANDRVLVADTSDADNSGFFEVVQVNRLTSDNVVIYNVSGAAQGGSFGTLESTKTKISFADDQSALYTTASYIEVFGSTEAGLDDAWLLVLEVNRGGGSNYNVVVDCDTAIEQVGPGGRIIYEGKSIFSTRPSLTLPTSITDATDRHGQIATNGVLNAEADVAANDRLTMDIISIPAGEPENLIVSII